ncbi:MAG: pyridoxine 5'-phosphate synthase [Thermoflavifilum aggregans]|nr:pyridoxine 5'-phosphate synthase [Thermoflavifilum aggregans]
MNQTTRLSVNINKVALIRNSRGENLPDIIQVAKDCQRFGADGITVHPRPDQRHIRIQDVYELRPVVHTEFNIEGYPTTAFIDLVTEVKPEQCTLVPDPPGVLTSNTGWDTVKYQSFLREVIQEIHSAGIRVSIFLNPEPDKVEAARKAGADRIELFTGPYAKAYAAAANGPQNFELFNAYKETARRALSVGLELNAGHDLNLQNLKFFKLHIPELKEVSIGHALICDALYYGLENTIQMYKRLLN